MSDHVEQATAAPGEKRDPWQTTELVRKAQPRKRCPHCGQKGGIFGERKVARYAVSGKVAWKSRGNGGCDLCGHRFASSWD